MKYLKKIFLILVLITNTNISYSENIYIAYINLNKIMNKSLAGKSISIQLEKLHKDNINTFKKKENELKNIETKIISQKNILSKEEFENKIKDLRAQTKIYRDDRKKSIDELTKKRLNATSKLMSAINPVLTEFAKANNISLIMQKKNIIIGKVELDITEKILELVNSKIKKINLN